MGQIHDLPVSGGTVLVEQKNNITARCVHKGMILGADQNRENTMGLLTPEYETAIPQI